MTDNYRFRKYLVTNAGLVFFVIPVALIGCNSSSDTRVTVSGRVTYRGAPLPTGSVKLMSGDQLVQAPIRQEGTFTAAGVIPGQVRAIITQPPAFLTAASTKRGRGPGAPPEKHDATPPPKAVAIPKKYKSFETSGIVLDVKEDMQDVKIDLVD